MGKEDDPGYDPIAQELLRIHPSTGLDQELNRELDDNPLSIVEYSLRLNELLDLLIEQEIDEDAREECEENIKTLTLLLPWSTPDEPVYPQDYFTQILLDNYHHIVKFAKLYFNLSLASHITRFIVKLIYSMECWELYHLLQLDPGFEYFLSLCGIETIMTPFGPVVRPPANYMGFNLRQGFQYPFPYPFFNYSYHTFDPDAELVKHSHVQLEDYVDLRLWKNIPESWMARNIAGKRVPKDLRDSDEYSSPDTNSQENLPRTAARLLRHSDPAYAGSDDEYVESPTLGSKRGFLKLAADDMPKPPKKYPRKHKTKALGSKSPQRALPDFLCEVCERKGTELRFSDNNLFLEHMRRSHGVSDAREDLSAPTNNDRISALPPLQQLVSVFEQHPLQHPQYVDEMPQHSAQGSYLSRVLYQPPQGYPPQQHRYGHEMWSSSMPLPDHYASAESTRRPLTSVPITQQARFWLPPLPVDDRAKYTYPAGYYPQASPLYTNVYDPAGNFLGQMPVQSQPYPMMTMMPGQSLMNSQTANLGASQMSSTSPGQQRQPDPNASPRSYGQRG